MTLDSLELPIEKKEGYVGVVEGGPYTLYLPPICGHMHGTGRDAYASLPTRSLPSREEYD